MHNYGAIPQGAYRQMPKLMPRSLGFERYALGFDGVDDHVGFGAGINLNDQITVEALVKPVVTSGDALNSILADGDVSIRFDIDQTIPSRVLFYLIGVRNWVIADMINWFDGNFHHIVGTYDKNAGANNMKVYGDVETMVQRTAVGGLTNIPPQLRVGGWRTWANRYKGLIGFIRIYTLALSQGEVRWNRLNYHNPVRPDKLVLWLPMEEGAGLTTHDKSGFGNNGALLPALSPPTWERVKQYELRAQTEQ